jgi:hypothetical protein
MSIKGAGAHVVNGDAPEVLGGVREPIASRSLENRHLLHVGVDIGLTKVNGKSGIFAEIAVRLGKSFGGRRRSACSGSLPSAKTHRCAQIRRAIAQNYHTRAEHSSPTALTSWCSTNAVCAAFSSRTSTLPPSPHRLSLHKDCLDRRRLTISCRKYSISDMDRPCNSARSSFRVFASIR